MKKVLLVVLMLCLALVFAVGCTSDDAALQEFLDIQNEMFESTNSDMMSISVAAEGTVLTYTYVIGMEGFDEEMIQPTLDAMSAEGQMMLDAAQEAVPSITAIILEFRDDTGSVLASTEFK